MVLHAIQHFFNQSEQYIHTIQSDIHTIFKLFLVFFTTWVRSDFPSLAFAAGGRWKSNCLFESDNLVLCLSSQQVKTDCSLSTHLLTCIFPYLRHHITSSACFLPSESCRNMSVETSSSLSVFLGSVALFFDSIIMGD